MAKSRAAEHVLFWIILLFSLLIFSQAACAAYKESVHSAWHRHGDNFTIDDIVFKIKASSTPIKVFVSADDDIMFIENGSCADKPYMKICMTGIKQPDFELHELYSPEDYEYHIEIEYYLADLVIEKEIKNNELLIGEKTRVEIAIQNSGSLKASSIHFADSYPNFIVSNVLGCSIYKNNITWGGSLNINQRKTCAYDIKATAAGSFESRANAEYMAGVGSRTRTANSEQITITVPDYEMNINTSYSPSSIWAGDAFDFNIILNNTKDDKSLESVFLSIQIPEGLEIIERSDDLSPQGSALVWTGILRSSEARNFWIKFRAKHSGMKEIKTGVSYKVGNIVRAFERGSNISVAIDKLAFQYLSFNETGISGKSSRIEININNPGGRYLFRNLKSSASTNLPFTINSSLFDEIGKRRFRNLITKDFIFPEVDNTTNYWIRLDLDYETEYGQKIHINETRNITVNPKTAEDKDAGGLAGGAERDGIKKKIENLGMDKLIAGFIIFMLILIFSLGFFIRKVIKKVKQREQYKNDEW